jgi:FtsP/CotA-like multicopper oxidase with cupredoxin domain
MTHHWYFYRLKSELVLTVIAAVAFGSAARAQVPDAIAAPGESMVVTVHAEGAQVYECKAGGDGKLAWAFREPIATLLLDGKTVGRHYAGPTWEYTDGSAVTAKVSANAPAKNATDIPWLKLTATEHRGSGMLSGVSTVQRINTKGGASPGACSAAGTFQSVPYSADYVFLKR